MKKRIAELMIGLTAIGGLTSCGESISETPISTNESVVSTSESQSVSSSTSEMDTEALQLASYKASANTKLDDLVLPLINKISNDTIKTALTNFYNSEKTYINSVIDLDEAEDLVEKVIQDAAAYAVQTIKPLVISKLNEIINPLIQQITYEDLKNAVQTFYDTEMDKISDISTLKDAVDTFEEILKDTKKFIVDETNATLVALKNAAIEELDPYVTVLINKIPYENLKTETQSFYTQEKNKLTAVTKIEDIPGVVAEIKDEVFAFALNHCIEIAIAALQDAIDAGLAKIPNEELKEDLEDFADEEIAKLNAIEKIEDVAPTLQTVLTETANYIKELLCDSVKDFLDRLFQIETATAYDYLPEAMSPTYGGNLVSPDDVNYDFTNSTPVSSIRKEGFGEQWQMVVENINQSVEMAKVFNIAQTALNAAGVLVKTYIDNSYSDSINYEFDQTEFKGQFSYDGAKLYFEIELKNNINVPIAGNVKPVIKMEYDIEKEAKGMFISLGDAYKIKYLVTPKAYEMATTYGITVKGNNVSRSSFLQVAIDSQNKTTGHIYEFTTLNESDKTSACADFYVQNGYVSVVGNKASGMVMFTGFVNELYLANEGRLIGYDVREEKEIVVAKKEYNTLWFNIWDIGNVNQVKITEKTEENTSPRSTCDAYINGSNKLFSPTYNYLVNLVTVKTSRKYDIELRKRFYYTYNENDKQYAVLEKEVPMMFIQEGDNFNTFETDIKKANSVEAKVTLNTNYLNKIISDHSNLIDIFVQNKENTSSSDIIEYLSQYED